ncbi:hypothetical protein M2437_000859 [Methylorubrum pseudosasae]|nr:hypothetical protein [Methylorubrum pseudosasae]
MSGAANWIEIVSASWSERSGQEVAGGRAEQQQRAQDLERQAPRMGDARPCDRVDQGGHQRNVDGVAHEGGEQRIHARTRQHLSRRIEAGEEHRGDAHQGDADEASRIAGDRAFRLADLFGGHDSLPVSGLESRP